MINRIMLEEALNKSGIKVTSEHKRIMDIIYSNVPFVMPPEREWTLEVPETYPGAIVWLDTIKCTSNQTEAVSELKNEYEPIPF